MWRPRQVGRSCISNSLDWQTAPSALPDIKGIFGALANLLRMMVFRKARRFEPLPDN
jgi:hypothetical protein